MRENIIQEKSFAFSVNIVNLYQQLIKNKKEFVLSKQILGCGTSIGANVEEAVGAQSKKDFITKITIAYKEARETGYWLKLLREVNFISSAEYSKLFVDCEELMGILGTI